MTRGKIIGFVAATIWLLSAGPRCLASQSEIDALVAQIDAGFHRTFDGATLRKWQETYQSACMTEIPHLARLLQDEGVDLPFDPYQRHRDVLRQTLPKMRDRNVEAMDLQVQTSQKLLALPANSPEADKLRAQVSAQGAVVKQYDTIIATLQERLTYLEKCAAFAAKAFADAAGARQSLAAQHPAPTTSTHVAPESGATIAMPTGDTGHVDFDPKKGLSIGCVASEEGCPGNAPPPPPTSAASAQLPPADADAALRQAAQACKDRYQEAYDKLRRKRRDIIEQAKLEIPKLEACIRDKAREANDWQQRRRDATSAGEPTPDLLAKLRAERDAWQARAVTMEDQAAKNDAYRKWEEASRQVARLEEELHRLELIDETIGMTGQQRVDCEVRLQLMREKIAAAEKAMGDSLERTIAEHRRKRFAEIDLLVVNRNLSALQRCAAQGYLDLDDIMQELYK